MTKPFIALIAAAFMLFSGGVALACSCVRYASPAEHAQEADVIFRGRVVESAAAGPMQSTTRFEVLETLKGEPSAEAAVRHTDERGAGAACGIAYRVGEEALVIAHRSESGALRTSSCSAPRWSIENYRAALGHGAH